MRAHSYQGTTITLSTKTHIRYEGTIASTSGEGDTTGVTLRDVKDLSAPGAPLKETLFIAATNIEQWSSGPADAKAPTTTNGDSKYSLLVYLASFAVVVSVASIRDRLQGVSHLNTRY